MTLDTVLLALGPSDEERFDGLVATAADIAGPADATVVLLHVFDRDDYGRIQEQLDIDPDSETTPDDVARRYDVVDQFADALDERGVAHEVRGALGEEGESITRVASEEDADLVVVGGRTRSPAGKAAFGSIAQEVLLSAPCPVTFVRQEALRDDE